MKTPEPKVMISTRIPKQLRIEAKLQALREDTPFGVWIIKALEAKLRRPAK